MNIDGIGRANRVNSLALPPETRDIIRAKEVANLALCALVPEMESNGQILRKKATAVLIEKLELENFVKQNPEFTDKFRAVTIVIQNIFRRGYISRWNCPLRKTTQSRITTKGYIVTSTGLQKYLELNSQPSKEEQPRTIKIEKLEGNTDRVQHLIEQYEAAQANVNFFKSYCENLEKEIEKLKKEQETCLESMRLEQSASLKIKQELQQLVTE